MRKTIAGDDLDLTIIFGNVILGWLYQYNLGINSGEKKDVNNKIRKYNTDCLSITLVILKLYSIYLTLDLI